MAVAAPPTRNSRRHLLRADTRVAAMAAVGTWAAVGCTKKLPMPSKSVSEHHRKRFWLLERANIGQKRFVVVFIGYFLSFLCERALAHGLTLREEGQVELSWRDA